jgi:SAM-dependent methyltransferase
MKTEIIKQCIVCGSENILEYLNCTDHFVSGEQFKLSACSCCGFTFTNPRPTENAIEPYYISEDYVSHSKTKTGITNRLFHFARFYTIHYKKRILSKYSKGKSILDYGCGTGEFLHTMKKAGWQCRGIEPNAGAREIAIKEYSLKISDETGLSEIDNASLDAISLWHVMEHIYPLEDRLRTFHKILKVDGMLFVALPNKKSYDAKKYGEHWAAWDVPRHIYHFDPSSVETLLEKYGFEMVAVKPMTLDAFYISLLSEKYKTGSNKIFRAMISGLRSNFTAFFKNGNYSSLIYIFKKSK